MAIYEFEGRKPHIAPTAYVAPSAQVIGDVVIGSECYVGHGAILRGDYGTIEVGDGTAVEEGVIVHARPEDKTVFGKRVTFAEQALNSGNGVVDLRIAYGQQLCRAYVVHVHDPTHCSCVGHDYLVVPIPPVQVDADRFKHADDLEGDSSDSDLQADWIGPLEELFHQRLTHQRDSRR